MIKIFDPKNPVQEAVEKADAVVHTPEAVNIINNNYYLFPNGNGPWFFIMIVGIAYCFFKFCFGFWLLK